MTKHQKKVRERELLAELRLDHGFQVYGETIKSRQFVTQIRAIGSRVKYTPGVSLRLVVPANSELGRKYASAYGREDTTRDKNGERVLGKRTRKGGKNA